MKRILVALLTAVITLGAFSGCSAGWNADLAKGKSLTFTAADFVENSHTKHNNAKMDETYTELKLEKGISANFGYMVRTIDYRVAKGNYRFTANVKISAGNSLDPVVQLHVLSGNKVLANLNILGPSKGSSFQEYAIDFSVPNTTFLRFGVYSNGRNDVEFTSMTVQAIEPQQASALLTDILAEPAEDNAVTFEEGKLYYYDLRADLDALVDYSYQEQLMTIVSVLQGLVNRDKPRLYVRFLDDIGTTHDVGGQDEFWLTYFTEEKGWLPSGDDMITVHSAGTLLRLFAGFYDGLTVWDYNVPSTYNVGLTDCGVNNRLLVKYTDELDSAYRYLTQVLKIPVRLDLTNKFTGAKNTQIWGTNIKSTGSKKCDPYVWAVEQYIKTGKTNPHTLSAYLDGWVGDNGVTQRVYYDENGTVCYGTGGIPVWKNRFLHTDIMNRDYFIAKKAFFYDLSPVDYDTPIDDLKQEEGTDTATLELILRENNKRAGTKIVEVGGFTNWQLKYSDASKEDTIDGGALEPSMVRLLTKYNCTMQADASALSAMANGSIFTLYPAKTQYNQDATQAKMLAKAQSTKLENKNYVLIYMGDYDNSSWTSRIMPALFSDPNLGKLPLMWPICAINESRAKHAYDYIYEHATENDIFVGGNNGIGYNYLDVFLTWDREGINGDIDTYFAQTKQMYEKYDLDILGMYFGGWDANKATDAVWRRMYSLFSTLSPYGIVTSHGRAVDRNRDDDYYNSKTGTVFLCKDPQSPRAGRDIVIQSGNGNFLTEGEAMHQTSVISQSFDVTAEGRPNFNVFRPILASPTDIVEGIAQLQNKYPTYNFEVVDPYTFFKLYKEYLDVYRLCDGDYAGYYAGNYDGIVPAYREGVQA